MVTASLFQEMIREGPSEVLPSQRWLLQAQGRRGSKKQSGHLLLQRTHLGISMLPLLTWRSRLVQCHQLVSSAFILQLGGGGKHFSFCLISGISTQHGLGGTGSGVCLTHFLLMQETVQEMSMTPSHCKHTHCLVLATWEGMVLREVTLESV